MLFIAGLIVPVLLVLILLAILWPSAMRLGVGLAFFAVLFGSLGVFEESTDHPLVSPVASTGYVPTKSCYFHAPIDPSRSKVEQCETTRATSMHDEDLEDFESGCFEKYNRSCADVFKD